MATKESKANADQRKPSKEEKEAIEKAEKEKKMIENMAFRDYVNGK